MAEAKCSAQFLFSWSEFVPWLGVSFAALNPKCSIFLSFDQVSQHDFAILVLSLGEPQCRCCLAGTLPWIIYNIFIPSKRVSLYNQVQMWFAVVISMSCVLVASAARVCIWAQRWIFGDTLIQVWEYCRIMPFPSPAECGESNPCRSKLTPLTSSRAFHGTVLWWPRRSKPVVSRPGYEQSLSPLGCPTRTVTACGTHSINGFKQAIPSALLRSCWNQELCRILL